MFPHCMLETSNTSTIMYTEFRKKVRKIVSYFLMSVQSYSKKLGSQKQFDNEKSKFECF